MCVAPKQLRRKGLSANSPRGTPAVRRSPSEYGGLVMPKKVWSKEKVISELRRHRQDGPKMHPQLDDAARRHFGSLRAALKVAGLPCGKRPPPYESWTRDSVIEAIRERKRNGRSLRRARREASTLYSAGKRLFGNWSAACAAAGYPRTSRDHYTADEVRLRIIDLYERQLPLRFNATSDPKLRRSVRMHFGSWRRASNQWDSPVRFAKSGPNNG